MIRLGVSAQTTISLRIYSALLIFMGFLLTFGGGYLVILDGTAYYLIIGVALIGSGGMLLRGQVEGAWVYALILLGTLIWSIWEVGGDIWVLFSRLAGPVVFGGWLLLPGIRRQLATRSNKKLKGWFTVKNGIVATFVAVLVGWGLHLLTIPSIHDPIYRAGTTTYSGGDQEHISSATAEALGEWKHYGNDIGGKRFSPVDQITAANVSNLEKAWTYRTGPSPVKELETFEVTPVKVDDKLYLCTGYNDIIALDVDTGREMWRHKSNVDVSDVYLSICRGVAYYKAPEGSVASSQACKERIITNTVDARLIAVDAETGERCQDFGNNGEVSLLRGMADYKGEFIKGYYFVTSAPTVVRGNVVLGGWVTDGQYKGEPAGVIRAFDALTGEFSWAFDVGRLDRQSQPPKGETYTTGTPNSWAPMSADEQMGLVYAPTGAPTIDYYGVHRRSFDEKFANSVIAINAETGRLKWSFQTVHHDIWDYDVGSQPTLVDIETKDGIEKALIQPTKHGEVYVLNRETGEPIYPVEEKAVPQAGAVPSENLSPTQPISVGMPSFQGYELSERDMWGITPFDALWCRVRFKQARYEGRFTPTGLDWSIQYPGYNGGIDWGSVSVDPQRQLLIVNSLRVANYNRLLTREQVQALGLDPRGPGDTNPPGGTVPQEGVPYGAEIAPFMSPLEIPCQRPPYGLLSAVDLKSGKLVWNRTNGNTRDAGPFNIGIGVPLPMGMPQAGGSMTTKSGLTFIAATQDGYFRAFDTATGELLWETRLPAGGQATPMTYISPSTGRQYVVIAAGGHPAYQTRLGDYVVAYALPKEKEK